MLVIRAEQIRIFEQQDLERFELRMLEHLVEFFPVRCGGLGQEEIRQTIRHAVQRAALFGIVIERDVAKYVDLTVIFGKNFDSDPALPWVGRILGSPETENGTDRINRLWTEAEPWMHERGA